MNTATTIAIPYADLCALRPTRSDVDFFLRSAGLRLETCDPDELAWAEREALEAAMRDLLVAAGLLDWTNVEPLRKEG